MKIAYEIYYILLLIAMIVTINPARKDRRIWIFFAVIATSFIEEIAFEILLFRTGKNQFIIYHLYAPVYYTLFASFFYSVIPLKIVKKIIPYSIGFFVGGSLASYLNTGSTFLFPGLKLDIMGFLLIPLCLVAIYSLDVSDLSPIYRHPVFWIGIATFIFYASDFVVIGLKSYLSGSNNTRGKVEMITRELNFANNYLYYLLLIIGMICSVKSSRRNLSSP